MHKGAMATWAALIAGCITCSVAGATSPPGSASSDAAGGQVVRPPPPPPPPVQEPVDGALPGDRCDAFMVSLGVAEFDIPDPGWVWVASTPEPNAPQYQSVTGIVSESRITHTDFPAAHDSHDINIYVEVDPNSVGLLSTVNKPNTEDTVRSQDEFLTPTTLELEWEIGLTPQNHGPGAQASIFPLWAWPSIGDRVWADGHWIFDCGHGKLVESDQRRYYRTELHPVRAIATLREQVTRTPFSSRPVPVTVADIYIHGRGGYAVDILNCGLEIMIAEDPESCHTKTTPIAENYYIFVPAPPRPSDDATLRWWVRDGPGNNLANPPRIEDWGPSGARVTVPLFGSGAQPTDIYARRIVLAWDEAPQQPVYQYRLTLDQMDLHEDHDADPGDCECEFFWMNVDKAEIAWIRLADYALGNMNDYDDDQGLGDGIMEFSDATFDIYVRDGERFTVRAHGYDQDCFDDIFGDHAFRSTPFVNCYLGEGAFNLEPGDNDNFAEFSATFIGGNPDPTGRHDITASGEYDLEFTIELLDMWP